MNPTNSNLVLDYIVSWDMALNIKDIGVMILFLNVFAFLVMLPPNSTSQLFTDQFLELFSPESDNLMCLQIKHQISPVISLANLVDLHEYMNSLLI